jgi:hypothetical protein
MCLGERADLKSEKWVMPVNKLDNGGGIGQNRNIRERLGPFSIV